jgi:hypothetical protein
VVLYTRNWKRARSSIVGGMRGLNPKGKRHQRYWDYQHADESVDWTPRQAIRVICTHMLSVFLSSL